MLFNLTEWCVYIETPGLKFLGRQLVGFFAHLEYDINANRKELRLILDHTMPEHDTPLLMSHVIHLGPWSLLESIERAMQVAELAAKHASDSNTSFPPEVTEFLQDDYAPLLSLLLYICSINGEIGSGDRRPTRPRPKKTKRGQRIFPPAKVSVWDIGVRMGAALRKAKEYSSTEAPGTSESAKQRARPRPHYRRAHWHGYWTGPRDGEQKFILKWISPVLVGSGEIPVTVRLIE